MFPCRYPHNDILKSRVHLPLMGGKEAGRGRMPDLRSHSKLMGHRGSNLGSGSCLPLNLCPVKISLHSTVVQTQSPSPSVECEGLVHRTPPEQCGSPGCLLPFSPSASLVLLVPSRLVPSPYCLAVPLDHLLPISAPAAGWFEDIWR